MANTRLSQIIGNARSGRAISNTYIKKSVDHFLENPITAHFPPGIKKDLIKDFASGFDSTLEGSYSGLAFGEFASRYWEKNHDTAAKDVEELDLICLPDAIARKTLPCLKLAVDEYMDYAGLKDEYDKWLRPDCEAWETQHDGRAASIGDVIYRSSKHLSSAVCSMISFDDKTNNEGVTDTDIPKPFCREGRSGDLYETFLAGVWVWLLLIEAPHSLMTSRSN